MYTNILWIFIQTCFMDQKFYHKLCKQTLLIFSQIDILYVPSFNSFISICQICVSFQQIKITFITFVRLWVWIFKQIVTLTRTAGRSAFRQKKWTTSLGVHITNSTISRQRMTEITASETYTIMDVSIFSVKLLKRLLLIILSLQSQLTIWSILTRH